MHRDIVLVKHLFNVVVEGVCHKQESKRERRSHDPLFVRPILLRSTALLSQDDGYPLSSILAKVELMASSRCSAVLHLFVRTSSLMTVVFLTELLWCELTALRVGAGRFRAKTPTLAPSFFWNTSLFDHVRTEFEYVKWF